MHPNSWALTGPQMLKCWPFPAPASWTAPAATPILPRWTPPAPPVCFVPSLRPALWPSEKTLRDTVMQFLPFADILLLTADEMELLLDTREYQVGLFALLRGHTQLVVLETEEGVHAFTRAVHAFRPGLSAPPEELAARLLYQISQQELTLKKLMKCSAPALQTLL